MNAITLKPYLFFWLLSPIFFMIGYLSDKNTFDINIHDTYYVVEHGFVNTALSVFFILLKYLSTKCNYKSMEKVTSLKHLKILSRAC